MQGAVFACAQDTGDAHCARMKIAAAHSCCHKDKVAATHRSCCQPLTSHACALQTQCGTPQQKALHEDTNRAQLLMIAAALHTADAPIAAKAIMGRPAPAVDPPPVPIFDLKDDLRI